MLPSGAAATWPCCGTRRGSASPKTTAPSPSLPAGIPTATSGGTSAGRPSGRRPPPSGLSDPLDVGQPGLCRRDAEPGLVELKRGRLDADNPPSTAEGGTQFVLAYPARAEGPGLLVAEADQ